MSAMPDRILQMSAMRIYLDYYHIWYLCWWTINPRGYHPKYLL